MAALAAEVQAEVVIMEKHQKLIEIQIILCPQNLAKAKLPMMTKKESNVSNVTNYLQIFSRKILKLNL